MKKFNIPAVYVLATAVLLSAALLSAAIFAPAFPALAGDKAPVQLVSNDTTKAGHVSVDRVEARITDLHTKLHITADQTAPWNDFAATMRDNAKTTRAVLADNSQNAATMTAVDSLRSYQKLAQAHVDGLARLIPAFETLYATMSDDQKKTADAMFRHSGRHDQSSSN